MSIISAAKRAFQYAFEYIYDDGAVFIEDDEQYLVYNKITIDGCLTLDGKLVVI